MYFQFYIDGILYDDPIGYDDLTITIERDTNIKGLLKSYTNKLSFTGDAYYYLFRKKQIAGYYYVAQSEIYYKISPTGAWTLLYKGVINITDITFTHYPFNEAEATIEDNGWTSIINQNKSKKAQVNVGKSLNGTLITPVSGTLIKFFNSVTGAAPFDPTCYRVGDCFNFLVAFMSDGLVTYSSPLFEAGGEWEYLYLTNGFNINNFTSAVTVGRTPTFSFSELFNELTKKLNISYKMNYSGVLPEIIIDYTTVLFPDTVSETTSDPDKVIESYKIDELYASVKFGGPHLVNDLSDPNVNFPEVPFQGFAEEEYNVLGNIGIIDNQLDLAGSWITDHNIINKVLVDLITDYDTDIFLIETDGFNIAIQYDTFNPGTLPYWYNMKLTNLRVSERYFGFIPNAIASYIGLDANIFKAILNANYSVVPGPSIIIWNNDAGTDPGSNYDTATGKYTAPITGLYTFSTHFDFIPPLLESMGTELVKIYFNRYNSVMALLESFQLPSIFAGTDYPYGYAYSHSFNLLVGDIVTMEMDNLLSDDFRILRVLEVTDFSRFECTNAPDEGGRYQEYDPDEAKITKYDYDYPLTVNQMVNILANEEKRIAFTLNGKTFGGWINKAEFKIRKSMASFNLIDKNRTI